MRRRRPPNQPCRGSAPRRGRRRCFYGADAYESPESSWIWAVLPLKLSTGSPNQPCRGVGAPPAGGAVFYGADAYESPESSWIWSVLPLKLSTGTPSFASIVYWRSVSGVPSGQTT